MGAQKLSLRKRLVAGLGTIAMASLAVFGAGTAHAAPAGEGNIDFDATGSITVHKHSQPEIAGDPATGQNRGFLPGPLKGVEFSLQQVTSINLEKVNDWAQLKELEPKDVEGDLKAVKDPVKTNANGVATFEGLDVGVYVVTEGEDHGDNNIVRKAEPFLVMIPTAVDGEWNYDVHVYPKNSQTQVSKVLDENSDTDAAGAGDIISWNVSATAPLLAPSDTLEELRYADALDARLEFVSVTNVAYNGQAWTEGNEYIVKQGEKVTVELIKAGLDAVQTNQGKELTYKINTKIVEGAAIGDGFIANEITQYTNINGQESEFSSKDHTYWGTVSIKKIDKENKAGLANAEFQVFRTKADAEAKRNQITVDGATSVDEVTTFVTGADGTAEIGPLNAGADQSRSYWLVETKAPAGYQLDDTPREIVVTPGTQVRTYEVPNEKQPDFELPLTGAAGTGIFMLLGLALLTLGGGLYTRNRRKAQA